jgi:large subunit ribosomal protein L30
MRKLKVTQVKSVIDRSKKQKDTMIALGLKKMNQTVVKEASPQIVGMLTKVKHLVNIEEA